MAIILYRVTDSATTCVRRCDCDNAVELCDAVKGLSRLSHQGGRNDRGGGSPYSITERRVPELVPVIDSQPAGDVSHKPGGRLPLLSTRPAVTLATLNRGLLPVSLIGEQRHDGCEQFA